MVGGGRGEWIEISMIGSSPSLESDSEGPGDRRKPPGGPLWLRLRAGMRASAIHPKTAKRASRSERAEKNF
jgi:hypothetical protein